jgi:hypothetical protein
MFLFFQKAIAASSTIIHSSSQLEFAKPLDQKILILYLWISYILQAIGLTLSLTGQKYTRFIHLL